MQYVAQPYVVLVIVTFTAFAAVLAVVSIRGWFK